MSLCAVGAPGVEVVSEIELPRLIAPCVKLGFVDVNTGLQGPYDTAGNPFVGPCVSWVRRHGPHAPLDRVDPRVRVVEGVVLALVRDVRDGRDDLRDAAAHICVREPHVVGGGAVHGRPADVARSARQLGRQGRPAHVEAERRAPRADVAGRTDRAHARVQGVRIAGDPGQRDRNSRRRPRVRGVVPDDRVPREGRSSSPARARSALRREPASRRKTVSGRTPASAPRSP